MGQTIAKQGLIGSWVQFGFQTLSMRNDTDLQDQILGDWIMSQRDHGRSQLGKKSNVETNVSTSTRSGIACLISAIADDAIFCFFSVNKRSRFGLISQHLHHDDSLKDGISQLTLIEN